MIDERQWRWYLTVRAVGEWMAITGRSGPLEASNPAYLAAEAELGEFSRHATPAATADAARATIWVAEANVVATGNH